MITYANYPTYQVFLAIGVSAVITGALMPVFIRFMKRRGVGQQIRADGPGSHLIKQGTPTMGGVLILLGLTLSCLLLTKFSDPFKMVLVATLATGALGLMDDIESVAHKRSLGLTPAQKMIGLFLIDVLFCIWAVNSYHVTPIVTFPGGFQLDLGVLTTTITLAGATIQIPWLYLCFVFILMAGLSNAVNLTDGLDGLAGGCVCVVMLVMAMVSYRANDLNLAIFSASCAGACIGFLWFNCHPAEIFMGDTGSLALGAAFAGVAVLTKTEVFSLIIGALFVIEALSVMIQVVVFHFWHRRVFLMAPIHHHFEKLGWSETKVVTRFWIISAAFAAIGFALYFSIS